MTRCIGEGRSGLWICLLIASAQAAWGDPGIRLVDRAKSLGLQESVAFGSADRSSYILETTGTGAAVFDFDGDGDNDVFVANGVTLDEGRQGSGRGSFLYRNDGGDEFTDIAAQAGLNRVGWAQGVCAADYDNDGDPDLLVTYHGTDVLYRNQGNGTFDDATEAAGLPTTGVRWGAGCAFLDYDKDGHVDIFIANYVDMAFDEMPEPGSSASCYWKKIPVFCGPRSLPKARNWLYRNRGDGTFEDVSETAGITEPGPRFGLGVAAADFNNDGWPDIYVACDQSPSLLYENQQDGTFTERGTEAGVAYNFNGILQAGMGAAVADYDSNGMLDVVKTNFQGDSPSLYVNEDGVFYEDLALEAGLGRHKLLGWGVLFSDVDEDGWPDVLIANGHIYPEVDSAGISESYRQPTLLYRNRGDGRFEDVTTSSGPALQVARPARGMAAGDLDGDGRPEYVIVNVNQPPTVLRNEGPAGNRIWLQLEGRESNRSAVGARVWVDSGERRQMQEVRSGGSYFSHSEFALHFGLGDAEKIDELRVLWPSGRRQEFQDVGGGRYRLVEGDELAELDVATHGAAGH